MNELDGTIDSVQTDKEPYGYYVTVGYNFWPSKSSELQLNYIIDSKQTDFNKHWYLLNLQINI